ncbi:hypothetical protein ETI10_04405 [Macrococcoides goetzii]|nr:hypothetical protein [Macrococcus goetzii]TDM42347.1 hypothetical protein ETI10_04405 [Macrococcus goetzii]
MRGFFDNKNIELKAMQLLNNFNTNEFGKLVISDKPDLQDIKNEIGIEVTIVEFQGLIKNFNLIGKSIIEYHKMFKSYAYNIMDFDDLLSLDNEYFTEFLEQNPVYLKDGHPKFIDSRQELSTLKKKDKIYFTDSHLLTCLDSEGFFKFIPVVAEWVSELPSLMLEQYKVKEIKAKDYKNFQNLYLFIYCFSGDIEEIKRFELILKEYVKYNNQIFNGVFINNNWNNTEKLYYIELYIPPAR